MPFLIEVHYSDKKVAEYDKCSEAKTKRWLYSYGIKQKVDLSEIKEQKTVRFNKNKDKLVIKRIVE